MKSLRKFFAITALTLALTCSAFAGEMGTGYAPPPPSQSSSSIAGEMGTGLTATTDATAASEVNTATADPVREIVLNLLQGVLSLF